MRKQTNINLEPDVGQRACQPVCSGRTLDNISSATSSIETACHSSWSFDNFQRANSVDDNPAERKYSHRQGIPKDAGAWDSLLFTEASGDGEHCEGAVTLAGGVIDVDGETYTREESQPCFVHGVE